MSPQLLQTSRRPCTSTRSAISVLIAAATLFFIIGTTTSSDSGALLVEAFSAPLSASSLSSNANANANVNSALCSVSSSSSNNVDYDDYDDEDTNNTRRMALERILSTGAATVAGIVAANEIVLPPQSANAAAGAATATAEDNNNNNNNNNNANANAKQLNLSNDDLIQIVSNDLVDNQFLVNGKLTRSIYDESCTFRDEIDVYSLDKWIKGTSNLFDAQRSKVVLVPDSIKPNSDIGGIEFRFVEYLCFNVPVVKPIVYLSGTLYLKRSPTTGLITSYQEKWDQDVNTVLTKKSKLFTSNISTQSLDDELDVFFSKNANANANANL